MKLSKETKDILANFAQINPSIKIDPGQLLMTKAIDNTIYAEAEIQETFTEEWGIYSLSSFLRVLSIIGDDAEITSDGNVLTISGSGVNVKYNLSDTSLIAYPAKRPQLPKADVVFELTQDQLNQVIKAAQTLSLDTVSIETENNKIVFKAFDSKSKNSNLFSLDIQDYTEEHNFKFQLRVSSLNLTKADYIVEIASLGAIKFKSKDEKHSYILALLDTSSHDFEA